MFNPSETATGILEENDLNAVILITVDKKDMVVWTVKMRAGTSLISSQLIESIQSILVGGTKGKPFHPPLH